jgi:hypothetical protein
MAVFLQKRRADSLEEQLNAVTAGGRAGGRAPPQYQQPPPQQHHQPPPQPHGGLPPPPHHQQQHPQQVLPPGFAPRAMGGPLLLPQQAMQGPGGMLHMVPGQVVPLVALSGPPPGAAPLPGPPPQKRQR